MSSYFRSVGYMGNVKNGNFPENNQLNVKNDLDYQLTKEMVNIGRRLIEDFEIHLGPIKMLGEDPEKFIEKALPITRHECPQEDLDRQGFIECEQLRDSFRTLAAIKKANNLRKNFQVHDVTEEELTIRKIPKEAIQRAAALTRWTPCPISDKERRLGLFECEKLRYELCNLVHEKNPYSTPELLNKGIRNPLDINGSSRE